MEKLLEIYLKIIKENLTNKKPEDHSYERQEVSHALEVEDIIRNMEQRTGWKLRRITAPFSSEPVFCHQCGKFLNPPTMTVVNPICSKCWLKFNN